MLPLTEHEAFDIVAYRDGRFVRIQVKYRAAVDNCVVVGFRSSWADRRGVHTVPMDKNAVDYVCIYCPDTKQCYYVDPKHYDRELRLRLAPSRNNQRKGVHFADAFTDLRPLSSVG